VKPAYFNSPAKRTVKVKHPHCRSQPGPQKLMIFDGGVPALRAVTNSALEEKVDGIFHRDVSTL
jgi:hypothetical protein